VPPGRDSVQISLAKEHIVDALQLDGPSVLGLEEHRVAHFDAAHIGSDRYNLGPTEPAPHLRGGGNDDAPTGTCSPSSPPSRTSTRSCRSFIGTDPSSAGRVSGIDGVVLCCSWVEVNDDAARST